MTSRVVVALRVKASPQRTFDVFVRDIGLWWKPNPTFAFTPRSPGLLSFEGEEGGRLIETLPSGKVFEVGKIRAWEAPHRLVFGWRQATFALGQDTEVTVTFEAVEDETRVTVEHRGWDTVPAEHVAKHGFPETLFLQRHGEWWRALLASLKSGIDAGEGAPQ
ncbi:SRPBCC family protein [Caulobacter sp. NIBR2454]|uniref:SRPBCC family protein n=1 Tax=Caulobacter sp. NIBR2454 TaxID=3015996 RepID=UPI0022B6B5F0|nr:SRPBCC family protein [Caulobacter sp. NIBR2454]